jgi:hypothetical protein
MTADFRNGMPGMAHSGAARAGMSNLTHDRRLRVGARRRARQRGRAGLDRLSAAWTHYGGAMKALIPRLKDHVPLRRMGVEAEVSAAICFLLSPAAGLHHRRHAADRRRRVAGQRSSRSPRRTTFGALRRLPPRRDARRAEVMPCPRHHLLDPASAAFAANARAMQARAGRGAAPAGPGGRRTASKRARFEQRGQLLPRERVARLLDRGSPSSSSARWPAWACTTTTARPACSAAAASSASAPWPASACWSRPATAASRAARWRRWA